MARRTKYGSSFTNNGANLGLEKKLWEAADAVPEAWTPPSKLTFRSWGMAGEWRELGRSLRKDIAL